jgi:hypothetical protein
MESNSSVKRTLATGIKNWSFFNAKNLCTSSVRIARLENVWFFPIRFLESASFVEFYVFVLHTPMLTSPIEISTIPNSYPSAPTRIRENELIEKYERPISDRCESQFHVPNKNSIENRKFHTPLSRALSIPIITLSNASTFKWFGWKLVELDSKIQSFSKWNFYRQKISHFFRQIFKFSSTRLCWK